MTTVERTRFTAVAPIAEDVEAQAVRFLGNFAADLLGPEVSLSLLQGGASNVNLMVETNGVRYALRLCDPHAARWGVDRESPSSPSRRRPNSASPRKCWHTNFHAVTTSPSSSPGTN